MFCACFTDYCQLCALIHFLLWFLACVSHVCSNACICQCAHVYLYYIIRGGFGRSMMRRGSTGMSAFGDSKAGAVPGERVIASFDASKTKRYQNAQWNGWSHLHCPYLFRFRLLISSLLGWSFKSPPSTHRPSCTTHLPTLPPLISGARARQRRHPHGPRCERQRRRRRQEWRAAQQG